MFIANEELDRMREGFKKEYDDVFKQIMAAEKKSEEHFRLLKIANEFERRTRNFIRSNAWYFHKKREHMFQHMEFSGIFGDRPLYSVEEEVKDGRKNNRFKYCRWNMKKGIVQ